MVFLCIVFGLHYLCTRNKRLLDLKNFEELGVSEEIRKAITELGFEQPMPVQEDRKSVV